MNHAAAIAFGGHDRAPFGEPQGRGASSRQPGLVGATPQPPMTSRLIHMLCETRRERSKFLPAKLLGEPGWDILLHLYAAHLDGKRVSITRLTRYSGIAATTVLRWLKILGDEGLLQRSEDPFDMRRVFVSLTRSGEEALGRYFADTGTRAIIL